MPRCSSLQANLPVTSSSEPASLPASNRQILPTGIGFFKEAAVLQLELNDQEQKTLTEALKSFLSDLRTEVVHTDRVDFRQELRGQEQMLKNILSRLDRPPF
jgi:hypothetical protein